MSEWFKELVLKTSDSVRSRGFESHSLRLGQTKQTALTNKYLFMNQPSRSTQVVEGVRLESG